MENSCQPKFDLLLKGAQLADPEKGTLDLMDLAIQDGKVAAVDKNMDAALGRVTVDLAGCILAPGLVDMHCHLYPKFPVAQDGLPNINADAHLFQSGVTTAVDAGTCGPRDFLEFKEQVLDRSAVRLLAFVNVALGGMVNLESEQRVADYHPELAASLAASFPDQVVGIKTAHYWVGKPFDGEHPAWTAVDCAVRAGELCSKPAMFDFQPTLPGRSYRDLVLHKMRPGDIHTHMYAQQFPVLDENGRVSEFLWEAKKRGVVFDLGHGAGSFWFRNAVPAFRQGYLPDTLSTDLYLDNVSGPVFGLLHIMSKYLSMGMELMEVIKRVTLAPAKVLGHPELGVLRVGGPADIAVLRRLEGDFGFPDSGHARMKGTQRLECVLTLREGRPVYDPNALTLPDWEAAPAPYWVPPGVL